MLISIKMIRIVFSIIFLLGFISTGILYLYLVLITAFGIGWVGGNVSLIEILWKWIGVFFISIYSLVSSIGLMKKKRVALVFGYSVVLALSIIFCHPFKDYIGNFLESILGLIIYLAIPSLIIIGLILIRNEFEKFFIKHYLISGFFTLIVLGWYFFIFYA